MNADLFVQFQDHAACAVVRREFQPLLIQKGWHEIRPGVWASPRSDDPDDAFTRLTMSIMPRGVRKPGAAQPCKKLPVFQRRLDLGDDVWALA
jgi:hypothetical protein